MTNINGEPILGATPFIEESINPATSASELIAYASTARQAFDVWYGKGHDSKLWDIYRSANRTLTPIATDIFKKALSYSAKEKIDLITNMVPVIEWMIDIEPGGAEAEEKQREDRLRKELDERQTALRVLLTSVPADEIDDQSIISLLDVEESHNAFPRVPKLSEGIVTIISKLSLVRAEQFLQRLEPKNIAKVVKHWATNEAKSIVEQLWQRNKLGADSLMEAISEWPIEEQLPLVRQIIEEGYDGSYSDTDPVYSSMAQWPHAQAKTLVETALRYQRTDYVSGREYYCVADAVSNWSLEEIDSLLANPENIQWMVSSGNRGGEVEQKKFQFVLRALKTRTVPLTDKMIFLVKESLSWKNQLKTGITILENHPEIFNPDMAPVMFLSPVKEGAFLALKRIEGMTSEEQYKYIPAIADGFSRYWESSTTKWIKEKNRASHPGQDELESLVAKWDKDQRVEIVANLLQRKKTAWGGGNRFDLENGFDLLRNEDSITDPRIVKAILLHSIAATDFQSRADSLLPKIVKNAETDTLVADAAGEAIVTSFRSLNQNSTNKAFEIASKYNLGKLEKYSDKLPTYVQSLIKIFDITDISNLADLVDNNYEFVSLLAQAPDNSCQFTPEDINGLIGLHLTLLEAEELRRAGINLSEIKTEDDFKKVFEKLNEVDRVWQDEQNIGNSFRAGAEVFGYQRMFKYLDRRQIDPETHKPTLALALSRHDALYSFGNIIGLYNSSGLNADQFWGNILNQVRIDSANYEEGNAHQHFNAIAATTNKDVAGIVERVQQYRDITRLIELAALFKTPQHVFASWNNLKRYGELEQALGQTEILPELKELKAQGKDKLYTYIETLAFHPTSKVDIQSVIRFWRDPNSFLSEMASHTPDEIHNRKKPSNYIHIPNLDLNAVELRDALVEGKMDTLQVFEPLEITYQIPNGNKKPVTFRARITRKSDPEGVVAGNDTGNCMPFGDGKNTVYTFNPNTNLFLIEMVRPDGSGRTIAESVLTKDIDIGMAVPEVISKLEDSESLDQVLPESVVQTAKTYIACDNIEVAPNYIGKYEVVLENIYRDFFKEYLKRYGESQHFSNERVIIGQGNADALTHLPHIANTFVPQAPVSYSDKTGNNVYILDLTKEDASRAFISKVVKDVEKTEEKTEPSLPSNIEYLTFEDALKVGYLESKIYAQSTSLSEGIWNMENGLIAKDINNSAKGRPNMSIKYVDKSGKMGGYMFAYEGKLGPQDVSYEEYNEEFEGEEKQSPEKFPVVYISDTAVANSSSLAGAKVGMALIQGFIDLYKKNYVDKNNLLPIFVQARETTSFRLIHRKLEILGKGIGVKFEIEELEPYQVGKDTMHPIIIRPL